jgi:hypothetical protein
MPAHFSGRCQFGLRTLLGLMTVVAVVLGVRAAYTQPFRREALVAAHVERLGGGVTTELFEPPCWPEWLPYLFADGPFRVVDAVDLNRRREIDWGRNGDWPRTAAGRVTDADLALLGALRHVRSLDLSHANVTDEGMRHLARLATLEELLLAETRITDEGVARLGTLKRLRWLSLQHCGVTDASLAHLRQLEQLEVLCLHQTHVTANGLRELAAARPDLHIQCVRLDVIEERPIYVAAFGEGGVPCPALSCSGIVVTDRLWNVSPHDALLVSWKPAYDQQEMLDPGRFGGFHMEVHETLPSGSTRFETQYFSRQEPRIPRARRVDAATEVPPRFAQAKVVGERRVGPLLAQPRGEMTGWPGEFCVRGLPGYVFVVTNVAPPLSCRSIERRRARAAPPHSQ